MHQNIHNRKLAIRVIPIAVAAAFSGGVVAQQVIEEVVVTAQKRVQKLQDVPISITAISGRELEDKKIDGFGSLDGIAPNVTLRSAPADALTAAVFIRGVGTGQPAMWADPSVGLYVDGVFVGKNQGAMFDLLDLERVEVLRGPQGTLFGRNTEGGAINFVSRPPSGEFSGAAGVEFGNYGLKSQRVAMDLPAMGPLKVNFAIRNSDQDGWMPKPNGKDWGSDNRTSARFGALLEINPRLKVSYAFDSSHISGTPTAIAVINNTGYNTRYPGLSPALPTGAALFTPAGAGALFSAQNIFTRGYSGLYNYAVSQVGAAGAGALFKGAFGSALGGMIAAGCCNSVQGMLGAGNGTSVPDSVPGVPGKSYWQHLDTEGHAINTTFNVNDQNTVKYIGSVRKMHLNENRDLAGSAIPVYEQNYDQHYKSWSHELQWIGNTERMNYVAGAYYYKDDGYTLSKMYGALTGNLGLPSFVPGYYSMVHFGVGTKAKALYGQIDYKLTDALTGTLGVRRTSEDKSGDVWAAYTNAAFGLPGTPGVTYQPTFDKTGVRSPQSASTKFTATTPVAALSFKVNEDLTVFGRVAKGFKSGGYPVEAPLTAVSNPMTPYQPEKSTSYEAGVKGKVLGGRGTFSATVFRTNLTNYQFSLLPPGSTSPTMANAGKAHTQGLEVEGAFKITSDWMVQFGYGYLSAKFDRYMVYNSARVLVDAAANTEPLLSPKNTLSLGVNGKLAQTPLGLLRGMVDVRYSDDMYFYAAQKSSTATNAGVGPSPENSKSKAMTIVNAQLTLEKIKIGGPGSAELALWVKNLTDHQQIVGGFDMGGLWQVGNYNPPRTYGVGFNYKW